MTNKPIPGPGSDGGDLVAAIECAIRKRSKTPNITLGAIAVAVLSGTGYNVLRPALDPVNVVKYEEFQDTKEAVWGKIRTMDDARVEIKTNVAVIATQVSNLTSNVDKFVAAQAAVNEKQVTKDDRQDRDLRELERKP